MSEEPLLTPEELYAKLELDFVNKEKELDPAAILLRIEKLEALVENLITQIDQKAKVDSMWAEAMVARNDKSF